MLRENEVVMLILGIGIMFLILMNMDHVKKIKSWKVLTAGYAVLLAGWFFTVLEGYFLEKYLNIFEHISYAISAVLLVAWCWKSTETANKKEA